jgi:hypothetical protein
VVKRARTRSKVFMVHVGDYFALLMSGADTRQRGERRPNPTGEGDWLYEGDEEPDEPESEDGQLVSILGWTKKQLDRAVPSTGLEDPKSPFELGGDEDHSDLRNGTASPLPPDAVDLVVEDPKAVDDARTRARQRGEPQTQAPAHVYRHHDQDSAKGKTGQVDKVYSPALPGQATVSAEVEAPGGDPVEQIERIEERVAGTRKGYDDEENPWA